jgi:cellulose synthase/poly-beta-1,6-N-acetylglucosamine synthase-like glycosyltransferase
MAFPWPIISEHPISGKSLVEDVKLGLDLAARGFPPAYCSTAVVVSEFPRTQQGARSQRLRWELGNLRLIATDVPPLLLLSIRNRDILLLAMTVDAAVPPLSFLALLIVGLFVVSLGVGGGAMSLAIALSGTNFLILCVAATLGWIAEGRELLPLKHLPAVAWHIMKKVPLYLSVFSSRTTPEWTRTDRTGVNAKDGAATMSTLNRTAHN